MSHTCHTMLRKQYISFFNFVENIFNKSDSPYNSNSVIIELIEVIRFIHLHTYYNKHHQLVYHTNYITKHQLMICINANICANT